MPKITNLSVSLSDFQVDGFPNRLKMKKIRFFDFYFEINVETIEMITKNVKKNIKSPIGVLKIVILIKISHINPVLYSQKKKEKKKKRFQGSLSRS
jgi:hypothetical protein